MKQLLEDNKLVLMEAAIVERLRRSEDIQLHPTLVNAPLIYQQAGRQALGRLYQDYIDVARQADVPFIMCTPTWRTNHARVVSSDVSRSVNMDAAQFMINIRKQQNDSQHAIRIGGMLGCKNDCYKPAEGLNAAEAAAFHAWQADQLAQGWVDFLIAQTLPSTAEAVGMAKAMQATGLPYIISFVIDRHGVILDGTPLYDAVQQIDAATLQNPAAYMVNCSYPTFLHAAQQPPELFSRLLGYLANASSLDHCELDNAQQLESEQVSQWGEDMLLLNRNYGISILGGCCGTGAEHLRYLVKGNRWN